MASESADSKNDKRWQCYFVNNRYHNIHPEIDFLEYHKVNLATAVAENDADGLKNLLETYGGISLVDSEGETLLHYAVGHPRSFNEEDAIVDLLLDFEGVPIDVEDTRQETPLISCFRQKCIKDTLKLIKKDANIHLVDRDGNSPLHHAIENHWLEICVLLIEKGIDINQSNNNGETAFFVACRGIWLEGISMLLFYGADVAKRDNSKQSPFFVACLEIRELLSDYVDETETRLPLDTVIFAARGNSALLYKYLEISFEIVYDLKNCNLECVFQRIVEMEPNCFNLFMTKFEVILNDLISLNKGLHFFRYRFDFNTRQMIRNLVTLLNSKFSTSLVGSINSFMPKICKNNCSRYHRHYKCRCLCNISDLFSNFKELEIEIQRDLIDLISLFVSKGIKIDFFDVGTIFLQFGFCKLFKQMISVDFDKETQHRKKHLLPELIYDPGMSIKRFLENVENYDLSSLHSVLEYFADPKLKEFCSQLDDDKIKLKLEELPQIPSLLELARNSVRRNIVSENFREFDETLEKLDIAKCYRKILTYEKKLYEFGCN